MFASSVPNIIYSDYNYMFFMCAIKLTSRHLSPIKQTSTGIKMFDIMNFCGLCFLKNSSSKDDRVWIKQASFFKPMSLNSCFPFSVSQRSCLLWAELWRFVSSMTVLTASEECEVTQCQWSVLLLHTSKYCFLRKYGINTKRVIYFWSHFSGLLLCYQLPWSFLWLTRKSRHS